MTYTLTPDEIEKVRQMVRILTNAKQWNYAMLTSDEERVLMELAVEIERFIQ